MAEAHETLLRRWIEGIDTGHWAVLEEVMDPGCQIHFPGSPEPLDREQYEQTIKMFYAAFPDLLHTIEDVVATGNTVVARFTDRGTHTGGFQGVAPTGKPVTVTAMVIGRVANGKFSEMWLEADLLGLMQQIGAVPAATQVTE